MDHSSVLLIPPSPPSSPFSLPRDRDIKLSNILYNNEGEVKLADFGLARKYPHTMQPPPPKVVTLWYRAPELLLGCSTYNPGVDLWAIGCVMAEPLLNKPLFPGDDEIGQIDHIFSLLGTATDIIWPEMRTHCSLVSDNNSGGGDQKINLNSFQQKYKYNNMRLIFP